MSADYRPMEESNLGKYPKALDEVTNNNGELPRRPMDWKDIFELKKVRDGIRAQLRILNKQIKNAEERNYKLDPYDDL